MQILRAAQRPETLWKNGGGLTREVALHPPGSDVGRFDWRVSLAEIRVAGPFSHFPGIERRMAVLEGCLSLTIGHDQPLITTAQTPPLAFPGEERVFAEPLGGAVTDLNVMTRRGRFDSRLTLVETTEPRELTLEAGTTLILALSELGVPCPSGPVSLAPLDAVRFEGGSRCAIIPRSASGSFWLIEIRASPSCA